MRRTLLIVFALAVVAVAGLLIVLNMTRQQPPQAVRLLPPADAIFYLNINIVRRAGAFAELADVAREPEYEDFVRQTGFQFDRDLDDAAFAIHAPRPGARAQENRYSEIFSGKWDEARMRQWLERRATAREQYRSTTIYSIPHEDRTVRVALLDRSTAAVSNTDAGLISFKITIPNRPQLGQDMLVDVFVNTDDNQSTGS